MFDALTQRIARQTTRRTALAALIGGALLIEPHVSEATKEAERRKDRRRKLRRRQSRRFGLKPISILVDNTGGDREVMVEHGEKWRTRDKCCRYLSSALIPAGESRFLNSSETDAYVWIDNKYWFSFSNDLLLPPDFSAALNGMSSGGTCCKPLGETVVLEKSMSEGQFVFVPIAGQTFTVRRNRDTNYKAFMVSMPAVQ